MLQDKLGYTKEVKEFAELQFYAGVLGDVDDEGIFPFSEVQGVSVCNPWMDASGRFRLTDEEAVEEWGFEFLKAWCDEAKAFLKEKGFEVWKKKLENCQ